MAILLFWILKIVRPARKDVNGLKFVQSLIDIYME